MHHNSGLRTPLKRARGLGAAHEGTHHFWVQRVSALALIPLSIWLVVELVSKLVGSDAALVAVWLHDPLTALLLSAFVVAACWHAKLGVQVIIEDYMHCECIKIGSLLLLSAFTYGLGAASLLAIAHLHFSA